MNLRVIWKRTLSRFRLVPSFCKQCGRDVHDYIAPDQMWDLAQEGLHGNVLCYDCFCERLQARGIFITWKLTP